MDFERHPRLKLAIVLIVMLHSVHSQTYGTDCNGKSYYCVDDQQFQVCVDLPDGKSQTADDQVYPCPTNSFCDNAGQMECDSRTRPSTTTTVGASNSNFAAQSSTTELPSSLMSTTVASTGTTTAAHSTTEAPFDCSVPGRFPNSNDCHQYYTCTRVPSGLRQTVSNCLFGMAFNPASQRCASDQSPCQPEFVCKSAGRFPDPSSSRGYYWCLWSGSSYTVYQMKCSIGQRFDAGKGQCVGLFGIREAGVMRMASPGRGGYNE